MSKKYVKVKVCAGRGLPKMDVIGSSDPYVVLQLDGRTRRTEWIKNDLSPIWNSLQDFEFQAKDDISKLVLKYDHDMIGSDDFIGSFEVPLADYVDDKKHDQWYELKDKAKARGEIRLEIYTTKDQN